MKDLTVLLLPGEPDGNSDIVRIQAAFEVDERIRISIESSDRKQGRFQEHHLLRRLQILADLVHAKLSSPDISHTATTVPRWRPCLPHAYEVKKVGLRH